MEEECCVCRGTHNDPENKLVSCNGHGCKVIVHQGWRPFWSCLVPVFTKNLTTVFVQVPLHQHRLHTPDITLCALMVSLERRQGKMFSCTCGGSSACNTSNVTG